MTLAALMARAGVATDQAGECWHRVPSNHRRTLTAYRPDAPRGVTTCSVCSRVVVRGMTDWWNR